MHEVNRQRLLGQGLHRGARPGADDVEAQVGKLRFEAQRTLEPLRARLVRWNGSSSRVTARAVAAPAEAAGLIVLTLHGDQIGAIPRFLDNDVLRRFGLPHALHHHDRTPAP